MCRLFRDILRVINIEITRFPFLKKIKKSCIGGKECFVRKTRVIVPYSNICNLKTINITFIFIL